MTQENQTADLSMMLEARERRAMQQTQLLSEYGCTLVSFSMNIAGPVKNSPLIRRGFALGSARLRAGIREIGGKILFHTEISEVTGCEGLYVTDLPADSVKRLCVGIEEATPLGRLFDLDVLTPEGRKLERPTPRRCLICGRPAAECARSRSHTVEELQNAAKALLRDELDRTDPDAIARRAVQSLLYEISVTPKPGLVDRAGSGSHNDMDFYTFLASASGLYPYFRTCAEAGITSSGEAAPSVLAALREAGREAERGMYAATGGVNTHKGAIFSMGLACAAAGRLPAEERTRPSAILAEAAAMCAGISSRELAAKDTEAAKDAEAPSQATAGERIYASHGITGIRGEAEAGFPSVAEYGLPVLEEGLRRGMSNDRAGCGALLAILAHTPDTNMISRGGLAAYGRIREKLLTLLEKDAWPDTETLEELGREFEEESLSPGGSADLLSLSWFLHLMREEA